jgi:molybdopterin-binding protein
MTIKAINVRNQFRGFVKEIVPGPVLSEVMSRPPQGS